MTSPVDSGTAAAVAASSTSTRKVDNGQLSPKAFLQLMVAQLQYQDPSKPADTNAFMQETATLNQVQSTQANSDNIASLLTAQRAQTASSLVGKSVTYAATDGSSLTGTVASATISVSPPTLRIGNTDVALSSIQSVLGTAS